MESGFRTQDDTLVLALAAIPAASHVGVAVNAAGAIPVHLLLRVGERRLLGWRICCVAARVQVLLAVIAPTRCREELQDLVETKTDPCDYLIVAECMTAFLILKTLRAVQAPSHLHTACCCRPVVRFKIGGWRWVGRQYRHTNGRKLLVKVDVEGADEPKSALSSISNKVKVRSEA